MEHKNKVRVCNYNLYKLTKVVLSQQIKCFYFLWKIESVLTKNKIERTIRCACPVNQYFNEVMRSNAILKADRVVFLKQNETTHANGIHMFGEIG